MPVLSWKSVFDWPAKRDGLRIIATRYWPRGLTSDACDLYLPDLAPSAELLRARQKEGLDHRSFTAAYRREMKAQKSLIRTLNWMHTSGRRITVMCACADPETCHRTILAGLIERGA